MYLTRASPRNTRTSHKRTLYSSEWKNIAHNEVVEMSLDSILASYSPQSHIELQKLCSLSLPFHYLSLWHHHMCSCHLCSSLHCQGLFSFWTKSQTRGVTMYTDLCICDVFCCALDKVTTWVNAEFRKMWDHFIETSYWCGTAVWFISNKRKPHICRSSAAYPPKVLFPAP